MIKVFIILLSIVAVLCIVLSIVYLFECGKIGEYYNEDGSYKHVESNQSFNYIIKHPAFKGFGSYMIPWESGMIVKVTRPLRLKFILPKLGAWDPNIVVSGINYLIDKINASNRIYYSFYTDEDKKADSSKENTGLIFLKGRENAPFALVCAGGGFTSVASIQEAFPNAKILNEKGYNVFVLKYRVGEKQKGDTYDDKIARAGQDLAAALGYIFKNREKFKVSTENYSIWGSSAGGRMVGNFSSNRDLGYKHFNLPAPAVAIMAYPGMPYSFSKENPPTFVVACRDDNVISVPQLDKRINDMKATGIEVEYYTFTKGGHGFGVGVGTDANGWMNKAIDFWEKHFCNNK